MKGGGETRESIASITDYHERTKHHPHRYARSPGYLDWENEPDPFRRYDGATLFRLPLLHKDSGLSYRNLYERSGTALHPFSLETVAAFLELSLGLSAWKSYGGASWALRMNPSSGNLHPTEAYLILPPLAEAGDKGGVYHYNPFLHALEQRAVFGHALWRSIRDHFGTDGFLVSLSSIPWREAWKYGERALRYCYQDIGHALAGLSISGNLLGWKVTYLNALPDETIETLLGFQKTEWSSSEREYADLLLFVHGGREADNLKDLPEKIVRSFESLTYPGEPNLLSKDHHDWHIIDEAAVLVRKPGTPGEPYRYPAIPFLERTAPGRTATDIIRRRRSALAFDGKASVSLENFLAMLDRTLPRSHAAPFDVELGDVSVHLLLFVHKVSDLGRGLYVLLRDEGDLERMKQQASGGFLWRRVEEATETLPLYFLEEGDFRDKARLASCHQDIAGDGVFSLAMIAKFKEKIEKNPFAYRQLHWEAGMVGQILYLEAEARSLRGTGMGCFFDDVVHEILGFRDNTFQDLYHFAVGRPVEDERLTTLPPYYHLRK